MTVFAASSVTIKGKTKDGDDVELTGLVDNVGIETVQEDGWDSRYMRVTTKVSLKIDLKNDNERFYTIKVNKPKNVEYTARVEIAKLTEREIEKARDAVGADKDTEFSIFRDPSTFKTYLNFRWSA